MNTKERINSLKALLSDEAIVEFNIQYNACFTSEEQSKLLHERTAAVIKEANKSPAMSAAPGTTDNR